MNDLFGHDGLICLDGDDTDLKRQFLPIIEDELTHQHASTIVANTTHQLEKLGYHTQITAREINFFYLEEGVRERIVSEKRGNETVYNVLHTSINFSQEEILAIAQQNPEKFSPNVVLRPLYQEMILPNLAYIGGPSEVPYWMQLKGVFDYYGVGFPMLLPRNFALYINSASQKRAERLGVTVEELFWDDVRLRKSFIEKTTTVSLDIDEEKQMVTQIFQQILRKALAIDKTLEGVVNAEQAKLMNTLEGLEKRLQKAEERNHETEVNQLVGLKNKLFPNGGLQERSENFLNFYLNDSTFIEKLMDAFDPLDFQFNILTE
jgi:bacillithiol biosynthesis cysteine-adding enzyme BshC